MTVHELRDRLTAMMNRDARNYDLLVRIFNPDSHKMEIITGLESDYKTLDIHSDL